MGGGIFAVLGLAVELARGGTPVAFAIAGLVALTTAYSYARLSIVYPSRGGTVEFLNRAFGEGFFTGGLNILLWLSSIVMLSLYAHAFGSYGASFFPDGTQLLWQHILTSGAILLFSGLNIMGVSAVGRSENIIVTLKLSILVVFLTAGFASVNPAAIAPSEWSPPLQLVAGGMLIFLAYEGFELIANTAENVKSPVKNLPRAFFTAVVMVIALYVAVSVVTVGNMPLSQIINARDYALAEAATPFLGAAGFSLIVVAALLSTGSAINATLYGTARVSYVIAREGELPLGLDRPVWNRPVEGLLITAGLTLLISNLFNLTNISLMGSSGFLVIFAAVNMANVKLFKQTKSNRMLSAVAAVLCIAALVILVAERSSASPLQLLPLFIMVGLSFLIELLYRASGIRRRYKAAKPKKLSM